jgi:SNF2 family DNA or RNA helicase
MPYGKKDNGEINYKIWFYDVLDIDSLMRHKYTADLDQRDRELYNINEERIDNLNKICKCLFNGTYIDNKDKFVFFKFYDYYPSILNRLWIEISDKCVCIYPKQKSSRLLDYNYETFEKEKDKIKSCISPDKSVYFIQLDVPDANSTEPNGGPHCLFKQRFTNFL